MDYTMARLVVVLVILGYVASGCGRMPEAQGSRVKRPVEVFVRSNQAANKTAPQCSVPSPPVCVIDGAVIYTAASCVIGEAQ